MSNFEVFLIFMVGVMLYATIWLWYDNRREKKSETIEIPKKKKEKKIKKIL